GGGRRGCRSWQERERARDWRAGDPAAQPRHVARRGCGESERTRRRSAGNRAGSRGDVKDKSDDGVAVTARLCRSKKRRLAYPECRELCGGSRGKDRKSVV